MPEDLDNRYKRPYFKLSEGNVQLVRKARKFELQS